MLPYKLCEPEFYHDSQDFHLHINMKKDSLMNSMGFLLMLADRRPLITYIKSEFEVGFEINIATILYVLKVTK